MEINSVSGKISKQDINFWRLLKFKDYDNLEPGKPIIPHAFLLVCSYQPTDQMKTSSYCLEAKFTSWLL